MKPVKGMYLDCAPADQPAGTYRKALNIIMNRLRNAVAVESGSASAFSVPVGYIPVAYKLIDGNTVVILSANSARSGYGEIGTYDESTGTYTSLLTSAYLNFSLDYPIKIISYRNHINDRIIVFTDYNNPPRVYNLDTPAFTVGEFNANPSLMNLFPDCIIPDMTVEVVESAGSLTAGAYYFAIAYELADGFVTDYLCISNPVHIINPETGDGNWVGGCTPGIPTSKGVQLTLTDLDTRYEKFRVAVVKYENGVYSAVETLPFYLESSMEVVISDLNNTTDILLEDVTINRANYTKAKTLTYENRKLYMGGLEKTTFPDYQQYANVIDVRWTSKYIPVDSPVSETYKDGSVAIYDKGFMPGEVYSLYIAWLLNDGSYSPAFHIPGRELIQDINPWGGTTPFSEDDLISSLSGVNGLDSTVDIEMDAAVNANAKFFQLRDYTDSDCIMAYWENEELYPADFPAGYLGSPTFANKHVRHHKFPSFGTLNALGVDMFSGTEPGALTLGIQVRNVPIPSSIADIVQGFEIFYVKRTYNNSLVTAMSYYSRERSGLLSAIPTGGDSWTTVTANAQRLVCPDLQKNDEYPSVSADYLRVEGEIEVDLGYASTPYGLPSSGLASGLSGINVKRPIVAIDSYAYDPFTADDYKEACLRVVPHQSPTWAYSFLTLNITKAIMVPMTINAFRTNVYTGLSYQSLVGTGKQFFTRDSASMHVASVGGVNCLWGATGYFSDDIYGGDIYSSRFYHFTNIYTSGGALKDRAHAAMIYWSHSNLGLRVEGSEYGQRFLPMHATGTYPNCGEVDYGTPPSDLEPDAEYKVDNYIRVYDDYSKQGDLNLVYPYVRSAPNISNFPYRIIASEPVQDENPGGALRKFLPLNYYEMPKNRGPITNLEGFNGMLLIQMEDSLYKTVGQIKLETDAEDVTIGSGDIFRIEPQEVYPVPGGYAGCQHPYLINVSKAGYFFVDHKACKIFMMRESLDEISNAGLRNFFEENLQFQLLQDIKDHLATTDGVELFNDNPFSPYGVGYTVAFDDRYLRLIFTKRDYRIISGQESAFNTLYKMADGTIQDKATSTPQALTSLSTYLEDNSFTISYDIANKWWASFHSYKPAFMMNTKRNFYASKIALQAVHQFNQDFVNGHFLGDSVQPSWIDITIPSKSGGQEVTTSISWTSALIDSSENPDFYKTWDKLLVYNTHQCSGWRSIDSAGTGRNARFAGGRWNFNDFRDMTSLTGTTPPINNPVQDNFDLLVDSSGDPVNIDTGKAWNYRKRFIDTYCIIRFGHSNANSGIVYLYDLETSGRSIVR